MAEYQFLDLDGLTKYDELIKNYIDTADAESIKAVNLADGKTIEFYKTTQIDGETPAYTVDFPDFDTSDLMRLVSDAAENDIAIFDGNGQVIDSGTALSDLAKMTYVGEIPEGYESTTIVDFVQEVANYISSHGYDDTDLKTRVSTLEDAVEILNGDESTDGSVAKAIADAKEELTEAIDIAVANAGHLKREIVDSLPDISEADELTIYLVPKEITVLAAEDAANVYDEYMAINGVWEHIGDTGVDLTGYATTEYVDESSSDTLNEAKKYTDNAIEDLDTFEAIPTEDIEALFS